MGNLTKYELLQHRHLSLLKMLATEGVRVECDHDGKWARVRSLKLDVDGTIRGVTPTPIPAGYEWSDLVSDIHLDRWIAAGWTVDTLIQSGYLRRVTCQTPALPDGLTFICSTSPRGVSVSMSDCCKVPTHSAKVEGEVYRLLGALRDAIVAASPAKVD